MRNAGRFLVGVSAAIALGGQAAAQPATRTSGPPARLEVAARTQLLMNGVATTPDGRMFGPFQRNGSANTLEVGEIVKGRVRPFPDAAWNAWRPGAGVRRAFVNVVSVRIGPDGALWVIDKGSIGMAGDILPGGPKLVRIDLATNSVSRIYPLSSVSTGKSFIDDLRFNGRHAYLTDAGKAALIVLDLETGLARRVLEGHPSTSGHGPLRAEGRELRDPNGKAITVNADQLEVSPDGRLLYFQPTAGPMSVVETRLLDDPELSPAELAHHVRPFTATPTTGGTAIDASGAIYLSDTDRSAILKVTPDGRIVEVLRDPRLAWVDALWIDDDGNLLAPASQLNRTPAFNGGVDATKPPYVLYRIKLHLAPVRR